MTERTMDRGTIPPSLRSSISAFVAMDFMRDASARQAAGEDIIHMEVGQPGTPAPRLVREAAMKEMAGAALGYTDALGHPSLRERIARHYRDTYGLDITPSRIVVTTGSSAGFILAFLALLDPGDGIALPTPGYPCYRQIAQVLGLRPVYLPARAESRFVPRAEDLRLAIAGGEARAVLIASPANPTGTMLSGTELEKLVHLARDSRCWFISDEIYHGLTYSGPGRHCPFILGRSHRHKQLLEILFDDRMARGLDGGAGEADPRFRASRSKPLHRAAYSFAAWRAGCF